MKLAKLTPWFAFAGSVLADSLVILDDRDPSIQYSNGWALQYSEPEYNGTGMKTTMIGATATLTFTGTFSK